MKVLSNLGLICCSILGCNVSYATSFHGSEYHGGELDANSNKSNLSQNNDWYSKNKISDEYKWLRPNSSYKAVSISKLSDAKSDLSVNSVPLRSLTVSDAEIFEVCEQPDDKKIQHEQADEDDVYSNVRGFFKKYKNPEYLVIFECDGITQTIHALNAEKALTNIYWDKNKNLDIWNKVNKWVGISYGCTLAGANDGSLAKANDIGKFNSIANDIFNRLKEDRLDKTKWYSKITNCLFNGCISCAKLKAENEDIAIIRASQFDQATPKAVQRYIADYFPKYVDDRLVFLQSGKDRRRVDPDYQKSYMSIINMVNETAKANGRTVMKKNFGHATDMAATVIDTINIPVAGKIIGGIGQLVTTNLKFKTIDDTDHCDAYKSMSNEVLSKGTLKLIINVDNYDGSDINSNLQVEHKPQDNKLKYRLTVNIPSTQYQDKKYNFEAGYYKVLDYLNNDQVSPYLTSLFDFIHNMKSNPTNDVIHENEI